VTRFIFVMPIKIAGYTDMESGDTFPCVKPLRTVTSVILHGAAFPYTGRGGYEEEVEDVAELEEEVVLLFLVVDLPCA